MMRTTKLVATGLALAAAMATPAVAQVSVTPYVGYYAPLSDVLQEDGFSVGQDAALLFGGRVGLSLGGLGLEGSVGHAASGVSDGGAEVDGSITLFSLRLTNTLLPLGPTASLYGALGASYIMRGGEFWDDLEAFDVEGINDLGGNIAVGARIKVSPTMAVRLELEDYIYVGKVNDATDETDASLQNDLVLSAGLSIGFGG